MHQYTRRIFVVLVSLTFLLPLNAQAKKQKIPQAVYPVQIVLEDKKRDTVYPSVAGKFMVYSQRDHHAFSVVRVSTHHITAEGRPIRAAQPKEAIRYGVAIADGAIGYVSNRMGPLGAWMHQAKGDGHIVIANMGTFTGSLVPAHLAASHDGDIWCFDTSLQKMRHAYLLNEFSDGFQHRELIGQAWRIYHSETMRYKQSYYTIETGLVNKFESPSLFIFDRKSSQLMMIPNAFGGAISPDGKRIVFTRSVDGNYDLWMQNIDGSGFAQLTSNKFGDFEPSFSPDGKKIAFVSNRDSAGDVVSTSIYTLDLESGKVERISNALHAIDGGPAWKGANTIIFHSNRDPENPQHQTKSQWNLWQINL